MTDAKTNLGVRDGLRAETIMRNKTTVWIEDDNMTDSHNSRLRKTREGWDGLNSYQTHKKKIYDSVSAKVVICVFYLGVGHATQAILREALWAPAADPLGHLLSSRRHPRVAFWNATFYRPLTHPHTPFINALSTSHHQPNASNSQAVDIAGRLWRSEGIVQSWVPVLGGWNWLHALKQ